MKQYSLLLVTIMAAVTCCSAFAQEKAALQITLRSSSFFRAALGKLSSFI